MSDPSALLIIRDLIAGYGTQAVVHNLSCIVRPGQIIAVFGHNGSGKSTLLKAIMGLARIFSGQIECLHQRIDQPIPYKLRRLGVSYLAQGGRVFPHLTVAENLRIAGAIRSRAGLVTSLANGLQLFPELIDRLEQPAATLSGGERQLLSLTLSLLLPARILLLDEPTIGLALSVRQQLLQLVRARVTEQGMACVLVEQRLRDALSIADCAIVLRRGRSAFSGPKIELTDEVLRRVLL